MRCCTKGTEDVLNFKSTLPVHTEQAGAAAGTGGGRGNWASPELSEATRAFLKPTDAAGHLKACKAPPLGKTSVMSSPRAGLMTLLCPNPALWKVFCLPRSWDRAQWSPSSAGFFFLKLAEATCYITSGLLGSVMSCASLAQDIMVHPWAAIAFYYQPTPSHRSTKKMAGRECQTFFKSTIWKCCSVDGWSDP